MLTLRELSGHAQGGLIVLHAVAVDAGARQLAQALGVQAVFANHDDEPQAWQRDNAVRTQLARNGVAPCTPTRTIRCWSADEVLTQSGTPYSVFTPYKNAWLKKMDAFFLKSYPVERHATDWRRGRQNTRAPCPRWVRSALSPKHLVS
jgi:deoxyribodipyrimidine photo-lyase